MTSDDTIKRRIAEVDDLDRIVPGQWARTYGVQPDQISEWVRAERSERVRVGA